jgi:hypothetical protein
MKILSVLIIMFSLIVIGCAQHECNVERGMTKLEVVDTCGEPNRVYNYLFINEEVWEYTQSASFYHQAGNSKLVRFNKDGKVILFMK